MDPRTLNTTPLASFPPEERWDDWTELDPSAWPKKVERHYSLVPTICFNCEAACGLMAYVDKETGKIQKLEGNPHHPGSRGKNCAKGPATLNQIEDPNRILYPLKRVGERGSGKWERTTWDDVLNTLAAKIRAAIVEDRKTEVMYHVGRPGEDGYVNRVLQSWGVDAHNSHTNVCSASARVGFALWSGSDRPSPDHANAKFILMLSAHLETGHYFNPHAQRIIEGKAAGAKVCVIDIRHSNTASKADWWLSPHPGTEAMLLLAMANVLLEEGLFDREFVDKWVNWEETLDWLTGVERENGGKGESGENGESRGKGEIGGKSPEQLSQLSQPLQFSPHSQPSQPPFDSFLSALREHYAFATPEAAEAECGVPASAIREVAREIGKCGSALATHVWRNAAAGNLGGWQVARCLQFLCVLVGAVGAKGGTNLHSDNKFVPATHTKPEPQQVWNELLYPLEYPMAYHELSYLLPHFLTEGRGKLAMYFTRVYNPVWTNPDGMMWERVLKDESKIELHAALTPVWSETAQYADFVLPMGNGAERHDLMSQETHAGKWIGFRQPVMKVARERNGETFQFTYEANPGEVWEEAEFWIELSWRIDPDGSLGIRKHFESPYGDGGKGENGRRDLEQLSQHSQLSQLSPHSPPSHAAKKITLREYYSWIFEKSVPGLPEAAAEKGLSPYDYMSRYGAFEVAAEAYGSYQRVAGSDLPPPTPSLSFASQNQGRGLSDADSTSQNQGRGLSDADSTSQNQGRGLSEIDSASQNQGRGLSEIDPTSQNQGRGLSEIDPTSQNQERGLSETKTVPVGFKTPSKKLELFSPTMAEWGWPDQVMPAYIPSHVHRSALAEDNGFVLVPTFRLPTLIHTRSANAKWLYELSNSNPVWMNTADAVRLGLASGDLVRISTRIGYYVNRLWVTEAIRPGVVACSHHLGRWRLGDENGTDRLAAPRVSREEVEPGVFRFTRIEAIGPYKSEDSDTGRIWWTDGGVHQNLTFCVQPDPVSGQHCWHQVVTVEKALEGDAYGDIQVDTNKSMEVYREWLAKTKPAPGPGGLRRPLWMDRVIRPAESTFRLDAS